MEVSQAVLGTVRRTLHHRWPCGSLRPLNRCRPRSSSRPPSTLFQAGGGGAGLPSAAQAPRWPVWVSPVVSRAPLDSPHRHGSLRLPSWLFKLPLLPSPGRLQVLPPVGLPWLRPPGRGVFESRLLKKSDLGEVGLFGAQHDSRGSQDQPSHGCPLGVQACPGPLARREATCLS